MIRLGKYQVCLLDLLTDSRTGKLSASKIWFHIANTIMSKAMLTNTVTWELMAAYGAIVGGSYVAIHLFKWRFRDNGQRQDYSGGGDNGMADLPPDSESDYMEPRTGKRSPEKPMRGRKASHKGGK